MDQAALSWRKLKMFQKLHLSQEFCLGVRRGSTCIQADGELAMHFL